MCEDVLTPLAILFLCSKEAKWITGVCLPVDAGVSFFNFFPAQDRADSIQTTAGKSDRPALSADSLAAQNTGIPNSKL